MGAPKNTYKGMEQDYNSRRGKNFLQYSLSARLDTGYYDANGLELTIKYHHFRGAYTKGDNQRQNKLIRKVANLIKKAETTNGMPQHGVIVSFPTSDARYDNVYRVFVFYQDNFPGTPITNPDGSIKEFHKGTKIISYDEGMEGVTSIHDLPGAPVYEDDDMSKEIIGFEVPEEVIPYNEKLHNKAIRENLLGSVRGTDKLEIIEKRDYLNLSCITDKAYKALEGGSIESFIANSDSDAYYDLVTSYERLENFSQDVESGTSRLNAEGIEAEFLKLEERCDEAEINYKKPIQFSKDVFPEVTSIVTKQKYARVD